MPLPGPLRSPKNLIALALGIFVAIVFGLLSSSNPNRASNAKEEQANTDRYGSNEIDRVLKAVQMARAWHIVSTGRLGSGLFQTEEDVVCPSDSHTITRPIGSAGPEEPTEEFIAAANMIYAREAGQPWRSQPDPSPERCQAGPSAGSQKLLTALESIQHIARVTEGPVVKLNSGTCRLWEFSGASNLPFHSICVEENTNLPRRLQMGGLLIEYSNWNQPVIISPPEMPPAHAQP